MRKLLLAVLLLLPLVTLSQLSSISAPAVVWETEDWTANETPYLKAEKEVLQALNTKDVAQMKRVYTRLEKQAAAQPNDALDQFRQATALSRLILRGLNFPYTSRLRDHLSQLSPHSYVFARTRYLVERAHDNFSPEVRAVGRRLLKRVPDDYQVLYYQATALDTRIPSERQESFAHAKRILQLRPNDYKSYYLMGDRYRSVWMGNNLDMTKPRGSRWSGSKDKVNRDLAINYFRQAKNKLPAGHPRRNNMDEAIKAMEEGRFI